MRANYCIMRKKSKRETHGTISSFNPLRNKIGTFVIEGIISLLGQN